MASSHAAQICTRTHSSSIARHTRKYATPMNHCVSTRSSVTAPARDTISRSSRNVPRGISPAHLGLARGRCASRQRKSTHLQESHLTGQVYCAAQQQDLQESESPDNQQQQQQRLDAALIRHLVASNNTLQDILGGSSDLESQELMDGVINLVYAVHGAAGSVIIKQALPYVRAVGESFPLSRARMEVEASAMQLLSCCCPDHVPALLMYDQSNSILAMQYLPPPHQKLLYTIRRKQVLPGISNHLSSLMSSYLAQTNLGLLSTDAAAAVISRFANQDIVAANERVVLVSPFDQNDATNRISPELAAEVQDMWLNPEVQAAAADLLQVYRTRKEALIHNDLHSGNLLVTANSLYLIDWEFATTGPISFDIGCLIGNLLLAVLSLQGMQQVEQQQQQRRRQGGDAKGSNGSSSSKEDNDNRQQQADWLLQELVDFWRCFQQQYPHELAAARDAAGTPHSLWTAAAAAAAAAAGPASGIHSAQGQQQQKQKQQEEGLSEIAAADVFDEQQWQQLLSDSCGFAGCCLIRLTIGIHHYPDIQNIADDSVRVAVERKCLMLGQQLLQLRQKSIPGSSSNNGSGAGHRLYSMHDVTELVQVAAGETW